MTNIICIIGRDETRVYSLVSTNKFRKVEVGTIIIYPKA
jgi:hypothetical protein